MHFHFNFQKRLTADSQIIEYKLKIYDPSDSELTK